MSLVHILVLALIQGLTEFLPVSSSAHLIFPSKLLGWEDQGIAFDVAVHVGTLLAVVLYYLHDLTKITTSTIGAMVTRRFDSYSKLGFCIILGTIPACIFGALFEKTISTVIRDSIEVIAYTTIGYGLLLGLASYYNKLKEKKSFNGLDGEADFNYGKALLIGFAQALAMIPGTSRSGITMTAGLFLGLKKEFAARFSFLLSIPIILASGLFECIKLYKYGFDNVSWMQLLLGAIISFITALIVIHLFLKFISRQGMAVFVIYRLILGCTLLCLF